MELDDVTRKYYRRLHILPRTNVLIITYALLIVILSLINSDNILSLNSVIANLFNYSIIGLLLPILYSILAVSRLFNLRRVIGLSLAVMIASLPAEIVFYRLIGLRGTGIVAISGFIFIILSVFINPIVAVPLATLPTLVVFYVINELIMESFRGDLVLTALTIQMISITVGLTYIVFLENLGKDYGYSPIRIMRAFINTWLTGNPLRLENEFGKYTMIDDLKVKVIMIEREGAEDIALIFPTLHYGPFRNVGSAKFIYHLQSLLEPRIKPFIFHTPGSHEHNLVSSDDSERIAKLIHNAINDTYKYECKLNMCKPYRVKLSNGWESFTLNGPTFIALFLVNKRVGNDDLPYELWNLIESTGGDKKELLIKAIADSHSFKGPKVSDVSEVKDLIFEVMRNHSCSKGEGFYVGYGEGKASTSECRGLCNGLVRALTIKFNDGSRYALVYIYGNNMDGKFRRKLEKLIGSLGIIDAEIITPDDHSCAASIKESPYDIVSECRSLVNAVRKALTSAINNEVRAKYSTLEVVIKNVKFVGHKIFDIAYSVQGVARVAEHMLMLALALLNLLPILFLFIK